MRECRTGAIVEKQIHLAEERARRLEQLARASGASESTLIEEALDLLFERKHGMPEPASGSDSPPQPSTSPITPEETVFIVGTILPPERLVHRGNQH